MTTKPLDQQLYEHLARKKRLKQERIDLWVRYLDHTVTALQLVVGTMIVVYGVGCIQGLDTEEVSREIGAID